ncbi:MAG: glutamate--tRNA ligase [Bacteroidales bacterium]|jgi:glutamyl-tRNA synthetase|nr:glutamate--tRNA ligase [Bacteroidales bacterium]
MTDRKIRVRFAPSPTGPLHIGGVRTALYNFLFARHHGGTFILRIEDTDQARYVDGAEEYIMDALEWAGIRPDEGVREGGAFAPYRQSERKGIYQQYALQLLASGDAYYAFDPPEELERIRKEYESRGETFNYGGATRMQMCNTLTLSNEEVKIRIAAGEHYVVRYRMPENEDIHFSDLIRGDIVVNSSTLDDKVLFKSDGMPTYHLANIVDDHLMEISHVIRGEEWLPSLPLHVMLYRSFGWEAPLFAHLPLLLKPTGKGKLSKRDGDKMGFPVFPLYWPYGETATGYREEGYFPEAFVNMLALLGWNPGTEQEIFSMEEMTAAFTIERVGKSGSRFDPDKAKWFNTKYFQMKSDEELAELFMPVVEERGFNPGHDMLIRIVSLVKERAGFVKELWHEADFFFVAPDSYDPEVVRKRWNADSPLQMRELRGVVAGVEPFTSETLEKRVKEWIAGSPYNTGTILNLFRLLMVGASRGPHLFDIVELTGRDETLRRLDNGIRRLAPALS